MKYIAIAIVALSLGGCQSLNDLAGSDIFKEAAEKAGAVDDAVVGNFAKGVALYCKNVPASARKALRNHLNARPEMAGAKVAAHCPDDGPITLP